MTKKFDAFIDRLKDTFDKKEVSIGMEVEKEHDNITKGDKLKRAKIVQAHLKERPDYYNRLKSCVETD